MGLNIISSKLTATPSVSGWVQVHEFIPQESQKLEKRGKIFAVIATKMAQEGVETITLGREIITRIHEEYYANPKKDSYTALQDALKKINTEFSSINPEIGIAAYVGDNLYVVGSGGIEAHVIRNKSMVSLLESKEDIVSVSGKPSRADIFLLGTRAFFDNFDQQDLKKTLLEKSLGSFVEEYAPKVHASVNLGSAGFLALKFGDEEKINIEKISDEPVLQQEVVSTPPKKSSLKLTLSKMLEKIPRGSIKLKSQRLDQATPQGRKTTLTAGVILLALLIVSVVFGLDQKKNRDLKREYGTKLESAINDYNQSLDIMALDKTKARELFLSAKEKLDEVKLSEYRDPKISELENNINSKQGEILGEHTGEVNDFLDLTLQTSGFNGSDLSSSGQDLFILDKDNKQIIKVEIGSKKASIVSGSDNVRDAKQLGSYEDRFFVLRDDGIYELTSGEDKVVESDDWGDILFYFYSSNLYLLDKNNNMIYRYPGTAEEFGEQSDWLAPGIEADFSKVVDMSIDGSIWLLSSSGKVARFTLGSPQSVPLEGLPQKLVNPTAIYTNEELEYVYILDANQERVVVLEKNGNFKVQYKAQELKNTKDLVVSEKEGKIILLTGSKLLSIELKHL